MILSTIFVVLAVLSGCAGPAIKTGDDARGYPVGYHERGWASWYGPGFHGKLTASGERFDMHQMTAAHRTLPFGTLVRVQSNTTGREIIVRINDRGPFVRGRIVDLARAAAVALGIVGQGTDTVDVTVIGYRGPLGPSGTLWVQVASFVDPVNAQTLMAQLKEAYRDQDIRVVTTDTPGGRRYRLQVGRFASENEARAFARRVDRQFRVASFVVREAA